MNKVGWLKKKIALLGFGVENQSLFDWLVKHGAKDVTICDKIPKSKLQIPNKYQNPNYKFQTGKNYLKNLKQFDIIFRSPGVPYLTPEIQSIKKAGTIITSQTKLFFDLCPAKIIGVTGTKGKGTTVSLITTILKSQISNLKSQIYCGGNIGNAPIEFVDKLSKNHWVVLELSSFQLQDLEKSPHVAVVLDINQDHLDHHQSIDEYIEAKTSIVKYQSKDDYAVINLDYMKSFAFALMSPSDNDYYFSRTKSVDLGCFVKWNSKKGKNRLGKIILRTEKEDILICRTNEVTLRGEHNLENICAAVTASFVAGAQTKVIRQEVKKFKGVEHRLEFVRELDKVKYYNDSFSTNPEPAIAAIKAFSEPKILILGGSEKNANYQNLAKEIVKSNVKAVISIGVTGPKIVKELLKLKSKIKIIKDCRNMNDIVKSSKLISNPGDVVILSPASASFGMFKNYKDRGEQFKLAVASLKNV